MEDQNPILFVADKLIEQIETESPVSAMWLFSAINRYLSVNDEMSLMDFKNRLEINCLKTMVSYRQIAKQKGIKIID